MSSTGLAAPGVNIKFPDRIDIHIHTDGGHDDHSTEKILRELDEIKKLIVATVSDPAKVAELTAKLKASAVPLADAVKKATS